MEEKTFQSGAKSEVLNLGLDQIPLESLMEIGKRFVKGEKRYGRDNWKDGDYEWLRERANHAIKHLYSYIQDTEGEDNRVENLAAVGWFAVIAIWHDLYRDGKTLSQHIIDEWADSEACKKLGDD